MSKYEIWAEEFKPEHARSILENSINSGNEFYLSIDEMLRVYSSPESFATTIMIGDEMDQYPIACGGIINLLWGRGEAWFLTAPEFHSYLKTAYKVTKQAFKDLVDKCSFRRIQGTSYDSCNSLFKHLGFHKEAELEKYGPKGEMAIIYAQFPDTVEVI